MYRETLERIAQKMQVKDEPVETQQKISKKAKYAPANAATAATTDFTSTPPQPAAHTTTPTSTVLAAPTTAPAERGAAEITSSYDLIQESNHFTTLTAPAEPQCGPSAVTPRRRAEAKADVQRGLRCLRNALTTHASSPDSPRLEGVCVYVIVCLCVYICAHLISPLFAKRSENLFNTSYLMLSLTFFHF
jgi:hypothetical protein